MTDVLTKEQRHRNMSNIRSRNTKPELIVRSLVHRLGYRFRLHRRDLPGKPDLVFVARRKIIFIHGCFWHMHDCKYGNVVPATNTEFWQTKRRSNVDRDKRSVAALKKDAWQILTIWECETKKPELLIKRIIEFLESKNEHQ